MPDLPTFEGTVDRVRIDFELSPSDHVLAATAIFKHAPRLWRHRVLSAGVVLALASAGALFIAVAVRPPLYYSLLATVPIALFAWIGGAIGRRLQWSIQARRMKRQSAEERAVTYEIRPGGLWTRFYNGETLLKWGAFTAVVETREFFLFVCAPAWGYYLPKRAIADSPSLATARSILNASASNVITATNDAAA